MSYVVNHAAAAGTSTTGASVTLDTSNADRIFLAISGGFFFGIPTINDSKGNTYTKLTVYANGNNAYTLLAYSQDSPSVGSGHNIYLTGTPNAHYTSLAVLALHGSVNSPYDAGTDAGNSSAAATTIQTGSAITPSVDNDIVLCAVGSSAVASSIDSSFSTSDIVTGVGGVNYSCALFYIIQTTKTAEHPIVTLSTSTDCAMAIAAFKANPGGPPAGGGFLSRYYYEQPGGLNV